MSTVEQVAARLAAAVDLLPTDTAATVIDQLDRVVELVDAVAEGTGSAALAGAAACFAQARDAACELVRDLHAVAEDIQAYREVLGFHAAATTVQPGRPAAAGTGRGRAADPERLLAALPVRRPGEKTRGPWVDEHGTSHDLLSGEHDRWHHLAKQRAQELDLVPSGTAGITSHVEVKFAMRMREAGIAKAAIAINKLPCRGVLGCHENLPDFLPKEASLVCTVPTASATPTGEEGDTEMGRGVEGYYLYEHGDNPLILHSADDMNRVIDELLRQDWEHDTAALFHLDHPRNARGLPDHEFWLVVDQDGRTGALRYTGGRGAEGGTWFSKGDSGKTGTILHYYMGSDNEYPADSEIPLDLVRTAAREFLESGGQRPTSVTWQPHWGNAQH